MGSFHITPGAVAILILMAYLFWKVAAFWVHFGWTDKFD